MAKDRERETHDTAFRAHSRISRVLLLLQDFEKKKEIAAISGSYSIAPQAEKSGDIEKERAK